jgi:hypothetical protein
VNQRPTRRWGLRVLPGYPVPSYVGDVITYGNSTREQVETIRGQMKATGHLHEVVELDEDGWVI